jgi:hypothetical protein
MKRFPGLYYFSFLFFFLAAHMPAGYLREELKIELSILTLLSPPASPVGQNDMPNELGRMLDFIQWFKPQQHTNKMSKPKK